MVLPPKVNMDAYLITNVLGTFAEILGIRYHHVNVTVVVLVGIGVGIIFPETGVNLCVAVLIIALGFESVASACGVFAPD